MFIGAYATWILVNNGKGAYYALRYSPGLYGYYRRSMPRCMILGRKKRTILNCQETILYRFIMLMYTSSDCLVNTSESSFCVFSRSSGHNIREINT